MNRRTDATVSLRAHLESLIGNLRERTDQLNSAHLQQHADALRSGLMFWENHRREHDAEHLVNEKANEGLGVRLNGMNEFRAQLRDQQSTFVTHEAYDARTNGLQERIEKIERDRAGDEGARARSDRETRTLIGVGGIVVAIVVIVVNILIKVL